MHILDRKLLSKARTAEEILPRCIAALVGYMEALRLTDPMRDELSELIQTLGKLDDIITAKRRELEQK